MGFRLDGVCRGEKVRGLYNLDTASSESSSSIFQKILGNFSVVVAVLFIVVSAVFCIAVYARIPSEYHTQVVKVFFVCCGFYSIVALVSLAWMTYMAVSPLTHLISWAKKAKNLESVPTPQNASDEILTFVKLLNDVILRLRLTQESLLASERDAAIGQMCLQVAHDIRSPLATLDAIFTLMSQIPEEERTLLRSAAERIREIANSLLIQHSKIKNKDQCLVIQELFITPQMLAGLIERIVSEKQIQLRQKDGTPLSITLNYENYLLCSIVNPQEFKNVLSNLIDNAVEAIVEPVRGKISISLFSHNEKVMIEVRDNGKGMSEEQLALLGRKGATFGKEGGSGLGLYHAKQVIERWNGSITFRSQLNIGTTCQLSLPSAPAPQWLASSIQLERNTAIVVVDDDPSIHCFWKGKVESLRRLRSQTAGLVLVHLNSPKELKNWINVNRNQLDHAKFLIDYEFNTCLENGLEAIQSLKIERQSILVTSHYENPKLQSLCDESKLLILPKQFVSSVPIMLKNEDWNAVFGSPT